MDEALKRAIKEYEKENSMMGFRKYASKSPVGKKGQIPWNKGKKKA